MFIFVIARIVTCASLSLSTTRQPLPLLPFALPPPCLRTNLIEVSLSIFTLVFLLSYNCFLSFLVARFAGNSN